MFVFSLRETVCQCLEVLVCECVCMLEGGRGGGEGPHVRNNDSYTTLGKNKHLKRPIYPLAGKFYKPGCSTFIHPLHFLFFFFSPSSAWDYKVVRLCQESSRCSAKGARAMCVRKKSLNTWLWSQAGGGVGRIEGRRWDSRPRGPETERERERVRGTVGDWPFTRQLFSLRCLFSAYLQPPSFRFALVIIWSRGIGNRMGWVF